MRLPEWHECSGKPPEERTPLETFIYENEPAQDEKENAFRQQLQAAIDYVIGEVTK